MFCPTCQKEVEITNPGNYADVLSCNHVVSKTSISAATSKGVNPVEAQKIVEQVNKVTELPKISGTDLINRVLSTVNQTYEDFFAAENPAIEDMIQEHGKDNAVLIFTAIHAHLGKTLFAMNRFKNLYYVKIDQLRKEIEDKAVKDLISNHDFAGTGFNLNTPKPKRPKTINDKIHEKDKTNIDVAKQGLKGLTKADGSPLDVTAFMTNLMFKKKEEPTKEQIDYKAGLEKIKENILKKDEK